MKVKDLIIELQKQDQDLDICYPYDGNADTPIDAVFLSSEGKVVVSKNDEVFYDEEYFPANANIPKNQWGKFWSPEDGYKND